MNPIHRPSTTGGIVYLISLGIIVVGVGLVALGAWRAGVTAMGVSFALAFAARLVLSDERAGMLRVRRRGLDLLGLAVCAGSLLVLVAIIPAAR